MLDSSGSSRVTVLWTVLVRRVIVSVASEDVVRAGNDEVTVMISKLEVSVPSWEVLGLTAVPNAVEVS